MFRSLLRVALIVNMVEYENGKSFITPKITKLSLRETVLNCILKKRQKEAVRIILNNSQMYEISKIKLSKSTEENPSVSIFRNINSIRKRHIVTAEEMKTLLVTGLSFVLSGAVIGNAYYQKKQFYPSVVYITKSNPSMAVRRRMID